MSLKHKVRELFWKAGYDIVKSDPSSNSLARSKTLFEMYDVSLVLDAGANTGQFAGYLRTEVGFKGKIISFEPLSSAFNVLRNRSGRDPSWKAMNIALGESDRRDRIHISSNSQSSSLLPMLSTHKTAAPESKYIGSEAIDVKKLDSIYDSLCSKQERVFFKIDAQGYERRILEGAKHSLKHIDTLQLEMSLVPLYRGETLFSETCSYLRRLHYSLVSVEPVYFGDGLGPIFQVDGIFHRY